MSLRRQTAAWLACDRCYWRASQQLECLPVLRLLETLASTLTGRSCGEAELDGNVRGGRRCDRVERNLGVLGGLDRSWRDNKYLCRGRGRRNGTGASGNHHRYALRSDGAVYFPLAV